jgi:hypothetical protein
VNTDVVQSQAFTGEGATHAREEAGPSEHSVSANMELKEEQIEIVKLEKSVDSEMAEDFLVRLNEKQLTCEILCVWPYSDRTDKVLREYYDLLVQRFVRVYKYRDCNN